MATLAKNSTTNRLIKKPDGTLVVGTFEAAVETFYMVTEDGDRFITAAGEYIVHDIP